MKHLKNVKGKRSQGFPEVITLLPEADVPFKGVRAWIAQGEKHQIVFFEMAPSTQAPEHRHNYLQWGFVIEGRMELTIEGEKRVYEKGDDYTIPAQARHSARFLSKCRVVDLFSEKTRYKTKPAK